MISPLLLFPASILLYLCIRSFTLLQYRQSARKTGLPYTYSPVHELQTWAYITTPLLRWLYTDYLLKGQGWPKFARFMIKDWMYEDKGRAHEEFGDVFLVVSPGGMICYIADAQLAVDTCTRRKDFIKPREKMKMIEPFGPNVVSSEGNLWRFHYRITAPPFGDAANHLVWVETLRQAKSVVPSWSSSESVNLKADIYRLGVNVMASAGFGRQIDWTDDGKAVPEGHRISLLDSIMGVVLYLPYILLLPKWLLRRSPWRIAHTAYTEFERYMREFIALEKARIKSGNAFEEKTKGNLLTTLLATSAAEEKNSKQGGSGQRCSFTDDEVLGNIFIFFMAGYDTTANTIIFSCVTLALDDEIQNRVLEELDRIYNEAAAEGREELSYTHDFPKFHYMLAFLYEILRIYPVVLPIGRITAIHQPITLSPSPSPSPPTVPTTHTLPPTTGLIINNTALHHNPLYWHHPHTLSPNRWLSPHVNSYDPTTTEKFHDPTTTTDIPSNHPSATEAKPQAPHRPFLARHARGTFMTFGEGPRACLGRRFAMGEFVAFFAGVLRENRIVLGVGGNEGGGRVAKEKEKEAVERGLRLRCAGSPISLAMRGDLGVRLVGR